jgi:hypothetical protein
VPAPLGKGSSAGLVVGGDNNLIVLINNTEAKDPMYDQLMEFLRSDGTDSFPYNSLLPSGFFVIISGDPWNKVVIDYYKRYAESRNPNQSPRDKRTARLVCADFAELLHNNAELSGIRAFYVSVLFEDGSRHALNAFKTIDKGLIFIDSTGGLKSGGNDKIARVKVGEKLTVTSLENNKQWEPLGTIKFVKLQF